MANIHPYLTFNNTKEALDYYKDVLGATNISRLPLAEEQAEQFGVPIEKASDLTMHSQCDILGSTIMAADNFMKVDPLVYDSISILIDLDSEDEQAVSQADAFWNKAVESGTVTVNLPFENQFWGGKMGDFTDKYGVRWMLHAHPYSKLQSNS
ncbi:VOC family protein [Lactococcus lactis]|uniref:VOC family protein n=1 Tax=Lactococcus lactis TaxID=1358 RepID=UPI00071DDEE3|nr:glyoxalase/bleomycin resistance/extradiol dioxygenase family protein [Lactococcus lactis]MRM49188.1 VOC family protein [Lactococcus cremoris]ARE01117.1 Glyoxalase family protein [Lactococcus lactis subsp. lactis]ARE03503.1 Glyoxalase family protein [Lactococcus lactis subsp. lactis]KSU30109.1 PhnB protein putative DNA binding 3-demethylubiquinone-9 3-methyltransferase domain protein [Lactococcus lactis subsp. lactis]MCT3110436.1 glyoxalase/bleomycin resistance/extradiol dioxygenase family p